MHIDKRERKWDYTDLFLWWTCVYMSFRAEHRASLILRKEYLRPATRVHDLPLQNVFSCPFKHALCNQCSCRCLHDCTAGHLWHLRGHAFTGKFKVSSAFACMFLTFLSRFLPFHCCLKMGHVQTADLTPLICRGAEVKHKSYFWPELCAD